MNVQQHAPSIVDVLRDTIADAQELVRGEVALAKAEMRAEVKRIGTAAATLAAAAFLALIAAVFLLAAVAWAVPALLGWPPWAGFALVGSVVLAMSVVLGLVGRRRVAGTRYMPLTLDTMKENLEWTRAHRP